MAVCRCLRLMPSTTAESPTVLEELAAVLRRQTPRRLPESGIVAQPAHMVQQDVHTFPHEGGQALRVLALQEVSPQGLWLLGLFIEHAEQPVVELPGLDSS